MANKPSIVKRTVTHALNWICLQRIDWIDPAGKEGGGDNFFFLIFFFFVLFFSFFSFLFLSFLFLYFSLHRKPKSLGKCRKNNPS